MLRNYKIIGFLAGMSLLLFSGCYKDVTVDLGAGEEILRPVSFTADIIPIFNESCSLSGCHNMNGQTPDLTPVNAYNSLINRGYVNIGNPEGSELYLWMSGENGTPMPPSGINQEYNALVLAWIKQGALNN